MLPCHTRHAIKLQKIMSTAFWSAKYVPPTHPFCLRVVFFRPDIKQENRLKAKVSHLTSKLSMDEYIKNTFDMLVDRINNLEDKAERNENALRLAE